MVKQGVGVLISNKSANKFFLQVKNETYPHKEFVNQLSFWGGRVEKGEELDEALHRELKEELHDDSYKIIQNKIKRLKTYTIKSRKGIFPIKYNFTFYHATVSDSEIELISNKPVYEGLSRTVDLDELKDSKFIWNLDVVKQDFIENRIN